MAWKLGGATNLPLGDRGKEWDEQAARDRIFRWAGWEDHPNPKQAQKAFFAYEDDSPTNLTAYKLPFADVVGGELKAMPRGLFAARISKLGPAPWNVLSHIALVHCGLSIAVE